ncbi:TPA: GNAT family N-acetyltransferase [Bacillus cereus]|nr:GNAT family N-acetyltransferase [Bacillus cereus]
MIRILTEKDANDYWNIYLQALQTDADSFITTYEEEIKRDQPIKYIAQNLCIQDKYTYGAYNENRELVGIMTLYREQILARRHKGHIISMYILPKSRGKGYACHLMKVGILKAKELNIEQINLTVTSNNNIAKRLYGTFGFKTYGVEEKGLKVNNQYRNGEHMVLFL